MSKKVLFVTVSCMFMLCMTHGWASAACHGDCFTSCCGGEGVCNDPVTVGCFVDCVKGCDGDHAPADAAKEKSSPNANVALCQEQNRNDVRWCNYPKREVQATRECLQQARQNFDSCMQSSGR